MTLHSTSALRATCAVAALAAAACVRSAPEPAAPGATLAYTMPAAADVRFRTSDTIDVVMQMPMGGGEMKMHIGSAGTVRMTFVPAGEALEVHARYEEFSGRLSNPMMGDVRAGLAEVAGEFVFRLDRGGEVETLSGPTVVEKVVQILGSAEPFRGFFPPLPRRVVARGETWTDTIRVEESTDELEIRRESIVSSAWTSDTVVAGRMLRVIRGRAATTLSVLGSAEDAVFAQQLVGSENTTALWDPERKLIVDVMEGGELSGTVDIAAAGMSMPIRMTHRGRTRLLDR